LKDPTAMNGVRRGSVYEISGISVGVIVGVITLWVLVIDGVDTGDAVEGTESG